ncbi:hypothetical protein EDB89DRAFT_1936073 [Lactarius sanguifluus]|nr:hypothetical protein EDB89DRAFT_1936073 [Lactarius sanguifluus]
MKWCRTSLIWLALGNWLASSYHIWTRATWRMRAREEKSRNLRNISINLVRTTRCRGSPARPSILPATMRKTNLDQASI